MRFQHEVWYVAALAGDVGLEPLRRVFLDRPVVLYRTATGRPVALPDRCPHRFARLSRGRVVGDTIECAYHGLRFAADGRCVLNPHGDVIAPSAHLPSYPVEERHGMLWIWMGDPANATPETIPDLAYMQRDGARTLHNYLLADYRYDILIDNLMDLSHADYLHEGSFSGGPPEDSDMAVREEHDAVIVERRLFRSAPPPRQRSIGELVDTAFRIHWRAGQVITFQSRVVAAGGDVAAAEPTCFSHIATPAGAGQTHYFMSITRNAGHAHLTDHAISSHQRRVIETEDGPMLQAIDEGMAGADLMELRPLVLPSDAGGLRVRAVMRRLIARENRSTAAVA